MDQQKAETPPPQCHRFLRKLWLERARNLLRKRESVEPATMICTTPTLRATASAALLTMLVLYLTHASAFFICAPRQPKDWSNLAKLVVETFDTPPQDATLAEKARWYLVERRQAERTTYRQYVGMARKMKGSKYDILVAKEGRQVIGVAEVGIHMLGEEKRKRPTIGVLCVSKDFRHQGVGTALVAKCQNLVADIWKNDTLYAEVEERNIGAVAFFKSLGFGVEDHERVMVDVRSRLGMEQRPHLLLSRQLV